MLVLNMFCLWLQRHLQQQLGEGIVENDRDGDSIQLIAIYSFLIVLLYSLTAVIELGFITNSIIKQ